MLVALTWHFALVLISLADNHFTRISMYSCCFVFRVNVAAPAASYSFNLFSDCLSSFILSRKFDISWVFFKNKSHSEMTYCPLRAQLWLSLVVIPWRKCLFKNKFYWILIVTIIIIWYLNLAYISADDFELICYREIPICDLQTNWILHEYKQ